jgi:hypothetical protein
MIREQSAETLDLNECSAYKQEVSNTGRVTAAAEAMYLWMRSVVRTESNSTSQVDKDAVKAGFVASVVDLAKAILEYARQRG